MIPRIKDKKDSDKIAVEPLNRAKSVAVCSRMAVWQNIANTEWMVSRARIKLLRPASEHQKPIFAYSQPLVEV